MPANDNLTPKAFKSYFWKNNAKWNGFQSIPISTITSFSHSHLSVIIANINVWTTVPLIIPVQIPCSFNYEHVKSTNHTGRYASSDRSDEYWIYCLYNFGVTFFLFVSLWHSQFWLLHFISWKIQEIKVQFYLPCQNMCILTHWSIGNNATHVP